MTTEESPVSQHQDAARFEWGLEGAAATCDPTAALVIVDVLSFTTAVTIAVGRGTAVYPPPGHRRPAVIIVAGERWPNGDLRPALEDLLGAGAILAALVERSEASPEAAAAEAAWNIHHDRLADSLKSCSSGRELTEAGYDSDVALASGHDAQAIVPLLTGGAFRSHDLIPKGA